ncbi:MAG: hypothetical protein M3440_14890 [Chloroflexota bacterium]|nr:hypothetical protein [Chloroflexota bacterium]
MSTCAIKYRLNAPGPSAFIVECNGGMRMYTRGTLGERMPDGYAMALTGARGSRWVPASGELILDIDLDDDLAAGWDSMVANPAKVGRVGQKDIASHGAVSA